MAWNKNRQNTAMQPRDCQLQTFLPNLTRTRGNYVFITLGQNVLVTVEAHQKTGRQMIKKVLVRISNYLFMSKRVQIIVI